MYAWVHINLESVFMCVCVDVYVRFLCMSKSKAGEEEAGAIYRIIENSRYSHTPWAHTNARTYISMYIGVMASSAIPLSVWLSVTCPCTFSYACILYKPIRFFEMYNSNIFKEIAGWQREIEAAKCRCRIGMYTIARLQHIYAYQRWPCGAVKF